MLKAICSLGRHTGKLTSDVVTRCITTSSQRLVKQMPPRPPPVDEADIVEAFLKGTGPGGQKINKTSSAVQLKHIPTGIVLKVQDTRSRSQNRKLARQMLAERVEQLEKGSASRVAIVAETKKKRKSSAVKKSKRKYKLLAIAKSGDIGSGETVHGSKTTETIPSNDGTGSSISCSMTNHNDHNGKHAG